MRGPDQRGTALVELSWLGILLLLPMLWIVMSVFEVQRGAFGISAAARSAARAYALAPDDATGLVRAREAARIALDDQGLREVRPEVDVSCTPGSSEPASRNRPAAPADSMAAYRQPQPRAGARMAGQ